MQTFKGKKLFLYNLSTAGHALFDSLLLTFHMNFLLPPAETLASGQMIQFIPEKLAGFIPALGLIMIGGRVVDAISDPVIASLSDKSTSRYGRRRFFLILSALPLALSTIAIFYPPVAGVSSINLVYLMVTFGLFFLFYTMYVAPYIALIPELAENDSQRLSITTAQGFFALLGGAIAMIGGPILIGLLSAKSLLSGYRSMIVILSTVGFLFLCLAIIVLDEKKYSNAQPSTIPLKESLRMTLSNRYFLIFLGGNMALWFVFNILRSTAIHIGETLMHITVEAAGLNFIILFVVSGLFFLIIMKLTNRFGKKVIMISGLVTFALFSLLLSLTGIIPLNRDIYGKIFFAFCGIPTAILLILPNVFISELCDYDYHKTGQHREGMYFGVHGFFLKLNLGVSTAISSFLFVQFGKDIANPTGVRLSLVAGAVIAVCGLLIFMRYPKHLNQGE